jgi:antitoxin VapB
MERAREIEEKVERLARLLADQELGGVLINAQHNFAWLTCGGTNGVDRSREAGVGSLLITREGRRFVLANRIEIERLVEEELEGLGFEPIDFSWEEERADRALVAARARSLLKTNGPLGSDLPNGGPLRVIETELARVRARLTEPEIARYRLLGRDTGRVIGELAHSLEPGLTEREIARRAADAVAACKAQAVVTLVAADDRIARFRHPVATDRRWEKVALVVVCARRDGLIASVSRLVCAGEVPDELLRRTEAAARVSAVLLDRTRPGVRGRELYAAVADAYAREGFAGEERLHHQGGATGYRTRDWVAHPMCDERVEACQAFAWNPSITGTKVEETCIAFDDHVEMITASPDWPMIAAGGYLLPGVLSRSDL